MSARQRFVAHDKTDGQVVQNDSESTTIAPQSLVQPDADNTGDNANAPIKSSQDSTRNSRRKSQNSTTVLQSASAKSPVKKAAENVTSVETINKQFNISALTRSKAKRHAETSSGQAKKPRISSFESATNNVSLVRSPKSNPLSPSRRINTSTNSSPFIFSSTGASFGSTPLSPESYQNQALQARSTPSQHTGNDTRIGEHESHIPVLRPSVNKSMSFKQPTMPLSLPSLHSRSDSLEPTRSEVFPIRPEQVSEHFSDLSPLQAESRLPMERTYDIEVPLDRPGITNNLILSENFNFMNTQIPDQNNNKEKQHSLKRSTKRIVHHIDDDVEIAPLRDEDDMKNSAYNNGVRHLRVPCS